MKKFIAVLAIAGSLMACNNAADSAENTKDSIDSAASEVKDRLDSTTSSQKDMIDSSAETKKDMLDSTSSKMDTTHN